MRSRATGSDPGAALAGGPDGAPPATPVASGGAPAAGNNPGGQRGGRGGGGGDPAAALLSPLFTDAIRRYVVDGLGYKTDITYQLSAQVQPWNYGQAGTNRYANVAPRLRAALEKDKPALPQDRPPEIPLLPPPTKVPSAPASEGPGK